MDRGKAAFVAMVAVILVLVFALWVYSISRRMDDLDARLDTLSQQVQGLEVRLRPARPLLDNRPPPLRATPGPVQMRLRGGEGSPVPRVEAQRQGRRGRPPQPGGGLGDPRPVTAEPEKAGR